MCENMAIIGCGPVGILGAQIAAALGANPLFVVEIKPYWLPMEQGIVPQAVGLNVTEDDIVEAVHTATGGHGVDV